MTTTNGSRRKPAAVKEEPTPDPVAAELPDGHPLKGAEKKELFKDQEQATLAAIQAATEAQQWQSEANFWQMKYFELQAHTDQVIKALSRGTGAMQQAQLQAQQAMQNGQSG